MVTRRNEVEIMGSNLIISHTSALLVHRAAGAGMIERPVSFNGANPRQHCTRIADFSSSGNVSALLKAEPLHILALSQAARHSTKHCKIHYHAGALPSESFQSLGGNVLVSSPALCFLQMCQLCAKNQEEQLEWSSNLVKELGDFGLLLALAELCGELCGFYSIAPDGEGTLKHHSPIATKEGVAAYLTRIRRVVGLPLAKRALRMAPARSASPRETALYLLMTTPWPLGYGFEPPETNAPIVLPHQNGDDDTDSKQIRFSDYRWKGKTLRNGRRRRPVTLEYDSNEFHTASAGLTDSQLKDRADRRDAIEAAGNGYLSVTTDHTKSFEALDKKMRQLASLLRIQLPQRSTYEEQDARTFQRLLFDTNRFQSIKKLELSDAKDCFD